MIILDGQLFLTLILLNTLSHYSIHNLLLGRFLVQKQVSALFLYMYLTYTVGATAAQQLSYDPLVHFMLYLASLSYTSYFYSAPQLL